MIFVHVDLKLRVQGVVRTINYPGRATGAWRPFGPKTFDTQELVIVYDNYTKKQIV